MYNLIEHFESGSRMAIVRGQFSYDGIISSGSFPPAALFLHGGISMGGQNSEGIFS